MAEKVPQFQKLRERTTPRSKYPWSSWLDGGSWLVYAGEDFDCQAVSFVSSASKWAARRGFSVESSISEDGLTVSLQAIPKRERKGKR